ncbi:hypothetical protein EW146_g9574 [Bondarzewia mesenterica]|uniref:Uncharacterized protein n=1 Tax=Bondarzewia mesenterica TaxID=1095465 RepID=A0A4S4LA81_9AGAM|nr:hypothetical protein EW146_g9574 [Bondarzewia mesenterica]
MTARLTTTRHPRAPCIHIPPLSLDHTSRCLPSIHPPPSRSRIVLPARQRQRPLVPSRARSDDTVPLERSEPPEGGMQSKVRETMHPSEQPRPVSSARFLTKPKIDPSPHPCRLRRATASTPSSEGRQCEIGVRAEETTTVHVDVERKWPMPCASRVDRGRGRGTGVAMAQAPRVISTHRRLSLPASLLPSLIRASRPPHSLATHEPRIQSPIHMHERRVPGGPHTIPMTRPSFTRVLAPGPARLKTEVRRRGRGDEI